MAIDGEPVVTTTWSEKEAIEKIVLALRATLHGFPHEIIVVCDSALDSTIHVARRLANVAVTKAREGQVKGLLYGMRLAKYPVIGSWEKAKQGMQRSATSCNRIAYKTVGGRGNAKLGSDKFL
jgi:hypothetical protein